MPLLSTSGAARPEIIESLHRSLSVAPAPAFSSPARCRAHQPLPVLRWARLPQSTVRRRLEQGGLCTGLLPARGEGSIAPGVRNQGAGAHGGCGTRCVVCAGPRRGVVHCTRRRLSCTPRLRGASAAVRGHLVPAVMRQGCRAPFPPTHPAAPALVRQLEIGPTYALNRLQRPPLWLTLESTRTRHRSAQDCRVD
jgi:hypothetical protein